MLELFVPSLETRSYPVNQTVLVLTRGLAIKLLAASGLAAIAIWLLIRWLAKRLDREEVPSESREADCVGSASPDGTNE
jgi:hypothetical protein